MNPEQPKRIVETEGASVDEAAQAAAAELGCAPADLDVEVLEEGRRGLFGGRRVRVRATVGSQETSNDHGDVPGALDAAMTEAPAPSPDEEEQTVGDTETTDVTSEQDQAVEEAELTPEQRVEQLDEEADLAADFVEGLLDRLDLPGDIEIEVNEDQAFVTVQDVGSGLLIGRRGATLDSLQELVRCAIQRQTERRSHVRVDVEGYRARQLEKLRDKCRDAIAEVRESSEPVRLEPMDAYERKMMHDLVAKTGGVTSSSEGNEPRRRVVIHPES